MPAKSAGFCSGKNVNGVAHIVHKRGGYSEENERKHMKNALCEKAAKNKMNFLPI
jgi:hypothetical protein